MKKINDNVYLNVGLSNTQHTYTPWILGTNYAWTDAVKDRGSIFSCNMHVGTHVPEDQNMVNATFIVRAVNAHEEMLGRLIHFKEYLEGYAEKPSIESIKAAIAKAEGE